MKRTLISLFCILLFGSVIAKNDATPDRIEGKAPINVGLDQVEKSFIPHGIDLNLKSGNLKKSEINVTYAGFPAEARTAFEHAASIWEQHLESDVPINILAKWEKLDGNVLALSRPAYFYKNFDEAPLADVYYPVSLVEKLSGEVVNNDKDPDIICTFNSSQKWYFKTDGNTRTTQYDLVTAALHEIAHGLGISGFLDDENGMGLIDNQSNHPSAYDIYIINKYNQRIADRNVFTSPSKELHDQLTSDNLKFFNSLKSSTQPQLYAPGTWKDGMSIYHVKRTNSNGEVKDELMCAFAYKGKAIHNPGESTLQILSEIGWTAAPIMKFNELQDQELISAMLPVKTRSSEEFELLGNSVEIIFSKDYFKTKDSVKLQLNAANGQFEGDLPLDNFQGRVQYFFRATTTENETFTYPRKAPENVLNFKVGPDYYTPTLVHNPSGLITGSNPELDLSAIATDNLGIRRVVVEYRLNGVEQEPFEMNTADNEKFDATLRVEHALNENDILEYRIIAEDNSENKNKKSLPKNGYFQVSVIKSLEPVASYTSDFDSYETDFVTSDFTISTPSGFSNGVLHTLTPYTNSELNDERHNLVAQLKYPIILEENGLMTFDEVVLVEPGEVGASYKDKRFWDYVIVEASKDDGKTWIPLVDGYDSGVNETWYDQFTNNLKSNVSAADGHENLFWQQSINLTEKPEFSAGDVVQIRFRLASDKSLNGWGWAIDNLKIQKSAEVIDDFFAVEKMNIYPNPFSSNLFIDCPAKDDHSSVEIVITDLTGKTVFHEVRNNIKYYPKQQVDLSSVRSGVYMASITDSEYNTITQKIIKL